MEFPITYFVDVSLLVLLVHIFAGICCCNRFTGISIDCNDLNLLGEVDELWELPALKYKLPHLFL